ncbi:type II toxin-antitoxin system RatA family toxin [Actinomadura flavalba]|uniref:type II toxin-antitoxin system RatA family toxin n=1 Tax=Actinomadura flavalba TaxID=1120938 RepID=UPI00036D1401|nr:SRPBCC family protein [Actinomadura flavalba]
MTAYTLEIATGRDAGELYAALTDPSVFAEHAPDVRAVTRDGDTATWDLAFNGASLGWTQRDRHRGHGLAVDFEQTTGDFAAMTGSWSIEPCGTGSTVRYTIDFRTSVAHLAGAIDPMAARTILRSIATTIEALAPPTKILIGDHHLTDRTPSGALPH